MMTFANQSSTGNRGLGSRLAVMMTVLAGLAAGACADLPPTAVYGDTGGIFSRVAFAHKMITMAVGQTHQLLLTGYTFSGDTVAGLDSVLYTSSNPQKAQVSPTGVVTTLETNTPTTLVQIVAAVQRENVTRYDTAFVYITDVVGGIPDSLSVILPEADTGYLSLGSAVYMTATVYSGAGTLPNPQVWYTASNPLTVRLSQASTTKAAVGIAFGETWIKGDALVYGVVVQDSFRIRMTYAGSQYYQYNPSQHIWPGTLFGYLRVGSEVGWRFLSADAPGIVFDKPDFALASPDTPTESGNIAATASGWHTRIFNTPGTYTWTSGTQTGTLVIVSERYPGE